MIAEAINEGASGDPGRRDYPVHIRLLGPLVVEVDGRPLGAGDFGGRKPKQVLEILLVHQGQAVAKQRIAELLWGARQLADPMRTLEAYVSGLRARLHRDAQRARALLRSEPGAYRLVLDGADVDLWRFDELVSEAAGAPERERLGLREEALALVRGEVLADELYADWAMPLRDLYAERYAQLLLDAADDCLAAARPGSAVEYAERVLASQPTRERAYRLLIAGHYARGDQELALRAYERCRESLASELGVSPMAETERVYLAVLNHEPAGKVRLVPPARQPVRVRPDQAGQDVEVVLAELDRLAPDLLGEGRPVRLAGQAEQLAGLEFDGHPWARLLVGCALSDADPADERGRRHALAALGAFRCRGDRMGVAFACFVLGCRELERGDISGAARWWRQARRSGGTAAPGFEIMLAHLGLNEYAAGQLAAAVAVAEEAVAVARLRGASRAEGAALVNLAFFCLWSGNFPRADEALATAEEVFAEVVDEFDRFELPLCLTARGVLSALRGDPAAAERSFTQALLTAQQVRAPWYEAIARALRAQFTAAQDPRRARQDARLAMAELRRRGDRWWYPAAVQAAGMAAAEAGMPKAAITILEEGLARPQPPLEQARMRYQLAGILQRAGRPAEARALLRQAGETFRLAGARYWEARAYVLMAGTGAAGSWAWMQAARKIATCDPAYQQLFRGGEFRLTAAGPGHISCDRGPVTFRTQTAERALFLLALAGPDGIHIERLADLLWPDAPADRKHLLGRIRTLTWDIRRGLGAHAWRLGRDASILRLDLVCADFDLHSVRSTARSAIGPPAGQAAAPGDLIRQLRRPLLTRWAYEEWVIEENLTNQALADKLGSAGSLASVLPYHSGQRFKARSWHRRVLSRGSHNPAHAAGARALAEAVTADLGPSCRRSPIPPTALGQYLAEVWPRYGRGSPPRRCG